MINEVAETKFLDSIKSELSLHSTEDAVPVVRTVVSAFRSTLPTQQADEILSGSTEYFRYYLGGSEVASGEKEEINHVEHLDEFVNLVMERDRKNTKAMFKTEIQALAVVLITLKKMFLNVDPTFLRKTFSPMYTEFSEASVGL